MSCVFSSVALAARRASRSGGKHILTVGGKRLPGHPCGGGCGQLLKMPTRGVQSASATEMRASCIDGPGDGLGDGRDEKVATDRRKRTEPGAFAPRVLQKGRRGQKGSLVMTFCEGLAYGGKGICRMVRRWSALGRAHRYTDIAFFWRGLSRLCPSAVSFHSARRLFFMKLTFAPAVVPRSQMGRSFS